MALAETLNERIDPFKTAGTIARAPGITARAAEARKQLEPIMRATSEATTEAQLEEARLGRERADKEVQAEQRYVAGLEEAGRPLREAIEVYPQRRVEDFDPQAGMEMAAMTALLGAFAGAAGGRAALKSVKGITEGYRAGKQDLYDRQVAAYEDEIQRYKDKINNAKLIYDNALTLEAARRGAGLAELKKLDPLLQDSVITAKARVGDFVGTGELIKQAMKAADDLTSQVAVATQRARTDQGPITGAETSPFQPDVARTNADYALASNGVPKPPTSPYTGLDYKAQRAVLNSELQAKKKVDEDGRKESKKSQEVLDLLDRAESYLKEIDTGGAFGIPIVGTPLQAIYEAYGTNYGNFASVALGLQRQEYVPGEGQISNYERELFARANLGLNKTNESNAEIIAARRAIERRRIQRNEFFQRYFDANKHLNGAQEYWNQYIEANPAIREVVDPQTKESRIVYNTTAKSPYDFFRNPTLETNRGLMTWNFKTRRYESMGE